MDFLALSQYAREQGASDIHLLPNYPPKIRVNGDIREVRVPALSAEIISNIIYGLLSERQKRVYQEELEIDFMWNKSENARYRVNAYHTINGPAAAFRDIPVNIKSLAELNTPAVLESLTHLGKGLVLVTGPTGSGKSTTLAAMIDHINKTQYKHIITIEDPVEFVHKSNLCAINHREVGTSTHSFAKALKSALREDPDVILVGELRDLESIQLALTAAETGHLVFATVHTSSASKTIDRLVDVFPGEDKEMIRAMLAGSIQAIVAQKLLKKADGFGRIAVHEIMIATTGIRNLIRENKIPQINSMIQLGSKQGMSLMKDVVKNLVAQGIIHMDDAAEIFDSEDNKQVDNRSSFDKGVEMQTHKTFEQTTKADEDFS